MLELKELAEKEKVGRHKRANKFKGGLFELKDYKLQRKLTGFENQNKNLKELYELAKYNPKYLEELIKYERNLEVLKAYYAYLEYW